MGFFSWITKDTNRSISNKSSDRGTFTVWMHTPDGKHYKEENYIGYGIFGGKDYYVALAEANPHLLSLLSIPNASEEKLRDFGINLEFSTKHQIIEYPIFTESEHYAGGFLTRCESCEYQGFFYDDSSDSDEEEPEEAPTAPTPKTTKKRQREETGSSGIVCKGRTGPNRSLPTATFSVRDNGSLFLRVDDENNLEFWLEITVPKDASCAIPVPRKESI